MKKTTTKTTLKKYNSSIIIDYKIINKSYKLTIQHLNIIINHIEVF